MTALGCPRTTVALARALLVATAALGLNLARAAPRTAHAQDRAALGARPIFTIEAPAPDGGVTLDARSLAVGPDGSVYVADIGHGRVQRFAPDGAFLGTWGQEGLAQGHFATPSLGWRLAIGPDGSIWTSEPRPGPTGGCNHRLQRFDAHGVFQAARWAPEAILAIGPDGSTYGQACPGLSRDVAVVRRAPDGGLLDRWGARGDAAGELGGILALDVAADGTVWVADRDNHRVQAFDASGGFLRAWGRRGQGPGELEYPSAVAVYGDRVYVSTWGRIHSYRADGTYIATLRHAGPTANNPVTAMDVAPDGSLVALSEPSGRIEAYSPDGQLDGTWGTRRASTAPLTDITRIMAGPLNSHLYGIFVLEREAYRVQRLDELGTPIGTIDFSFLEEASFKHPVADAAVAEDQGLWLLLRTGEIVRLDAEGAVQDRWQAVPEEHLDHGGALDVSFDELIYVSAFGAPWIHGFAPDGTRIAGFGDDPEAPEFGPNETWLLPSVAADGSVIVTDHHPAFVEDLVEVQTAEARQENWRHRIRRFSKEGELLDAFVLEEVLSAIGTINNGYEIYGRAAVSYSGDIHLSVRVPGADPHVAVFAYDGSLRGRLWPWTTGSTSARLGGPVVLNGGAEWVYVPESRRGDAPDRVHAFTPSFEGGTGWRVSRFDNPHAVGWPAKITFDHDDLDLAWGTEPPMPLPQDHPFVVRADGVLFAQGIWEPGGVAGELQLEATGGARLWLDDQLLLDSWASDSTDEAFDLVLSHGPHRLRVDSIHHGGTASVQARWRPRADAHVVFLPSLGAGRR